MGLDQYAFERLPGQNPDDDIQPEYIWRKHAKLQEFMERLFETRTGLTRGRMNCTPLELTGEDVALLEELVASGALPESPGGFFFGEEFQDEQAERYRDQDIAFCRWAQTVLSTRNKVFYACWW